MPADAVFVSALPGETRIALVEEGRIAEMAVERPDAGAGTGDVYFGRVEKVVPGLEAAFVSIGGRRAGFLALPDARPAGAAGGPGKDSISDYAREGEAVVVQVTRGAVGGKGPKLTCNVSLPGRFAALAPGRPGVSLPPGAGDADGRDSLRALAERLRRSLPAAAGILLRPRARAAEPEQVEQEIARLEAEWRQIQDRRTGARAPACLWRDADAVGRMLRDGAGPGLARVVIDDADAFARVKEFCARWLPGLAGGIELSLEWGTLFDAFGLEEQVEAALEPAVALSSGGRLVVAETAALAAIDVDTGAASDTGEKQEVAARTNREAAVEIARQVRLRNLGGIVVVDFAPLSRPGERAAVLATLKRALAKDPVGVNVFGFTRLGLVEMTRPRLRESLLESMTVPWPGPEGPGRAPAPVAVAFAALRRALKEARARPAAALSLRAPGRVVAAFADAAREARRAVEERLGRPLDLVADESLAPDRFIVWSKSG